jgi:hypothetical protein
MAQRIAIYVVGRGDIQKVDPYRYPRECYIESFRIICSWAASNLG